MKLTRRLYLWLGLTIGPLAIFGLRTYTKLTRAPRVRIIVKSEIGKILLLKNVLSERDAWTLPGGGVARGEAFAESAQRELREETGIIVPIEAFQEVATLSPGESGLAYQAIIYETECASLNLPAKPINPREIAEIGWFKLDDLPTNISPLVHIAVSHLKNRGRKLQAK